MAGAVDGFTINDPFWGSEGSGSAEDWFRLFLASDKRPDAGYAEPATYTVQYLDGGRWREVPASETVPERPRANLNEVRFAEVTTTALRVVTAHQQGHATGPEEIQVHGAG
ncbi:hypothetical protein ACTWP5_17770 [Streptomyces sp. 4N509B]|uniref:hypothetical protein n=1 Tax=Streptomyces sp. 4N509B TaxID=3457413 RepID=UPI003FCFC785